VHLRGPGLCHPVAFAGEQDVVFGGVGVDQYRRGAPALGEDLGDLGAQRELIDRSRSTVANIETGYQLASPGFCRKCDAVLSTGGVLRAALDELEELQRESHRRAAASAENDLKTWIEEWCQQGLAVPENPGNGAAAWAIR